MKITEIQAHPLQAPGRTFVIVTVHTDEGLVGVGEAGLQRRWQAIEGAIEHLRHWLVGSDPFRIEHLWQRMWRGGFYPADRLIGSAVSAIDIALWDIKGKSLGVPVYELLGGRCRDFVDAFTNPGYLSDRDSAEDHELLLGIRSAADPQATAELAKRHLLRGQKFFRLALPAEGETFSSRWSVRRCLEQLRAIRDEVDNELELMVDLHTRLSPDEAIWFCREAEQFNPFVVEDPIRSEHPSGYRRIRAQTRVPLAAGEQWSSKWEFSDPIENEWIDYARVDICIAGGITEARKIAALAEIHSVKLLPHNPLGPVCTAASLHLDLAIDNAGPQEVLFAPDILPDVFECDFQLNAGRLTVPTMPGLGVVFHANRARDYPATITEPPHFSRPDGSFTNY